MEKYGAYPFALLGINVDADAEVANQAMQRHPLPWPTIWDGQSQLAAQLNVQAYPSLYLIDADGRLRKSWTGLPAPQELDAAIESLLRERR